MNPQVLPFSIATLHQQAVDAFNQGDYNTAAAFYEELVEAVPDNRANYWHLGLVRLLQGQEADAQLLWLMVMAEAEPEQVELWTQELLQVLQAEAEQRETRDDTATAQIIRLAIRGVAPTDSSNLLRLIQHSLALEQLTEEALIDLGLTDLLSATSPPEVDAALLWQVLQQLLDWRIDCPTVLVLTAASLPYANNSSSWIEVLLPKAVILAKLMRQNTLASRYAELCLRLDPQHSETLLRLASFYQDEERYDEGIALAKQYLTHCQTLLQKIMGNALVLRGLMLTGGNRQEASQVLHQETALIQMFLDEYQIAPTECLDASMMCTPVFFYPYFSDRPTVTRPLQNQLSSLYQASVQTFVQHNPDSYQDNHQGPYQPYPIAPLRRSPTRKTLRVGYLSRCLWRHSVGWLSRWVFQHFDRDRFEVYAYFNHQASIDPFTQQWFVNQATYSCRFEGDVLGIALAIQEDEIDILVDLDSLTADYTCGVMALKPAPIQVTWLGLDATGLPAIDYFIADPYVLPEDAQAYYAEKIWRLPQTYIAVDGFEVGVPTLRRDQLGIPADAVVYLSAQFAYKRQPDTMRLQMRVLKEVPNSYFLIKGAGDQQGIQTFFLQIAEEEGVAGDRLKFLPRDVNEEIHRANLRIADVILDTFPYNGATTTLETLWMGIPLVTRVGQQFAARNSYTMMMNAGITEGIAWTDEDYVDWGVRLGKDAALRQQITWKLERSRQTSPLWNAKQFTRDLEGAYTSMWEIYRG